MFGGWFLIWRLIVIRLGLSRANFMTLAQQIIWGSLFLGGSLLLETAMLLWCVSTLRHHEKKYHLNQRVGGQLVILLIAIAFTILGHTSQIWLWAAALMGYDIFSDWNTALYFAMATYTTLGYGDIILDADLRIFAAFAAITGMLAFGISTAFLIAVMRPMFPVSLSDETDQKP